MTAQSRLTERNGSVADLDEKNADITEQFELTQVNEHC